MKIVQKSVSETQKSPFFYHGVIAEGKGFKLETYQDGEISYDGDNYCGEETTELCKTDLTDADIDDELIVDIYVDKFFAITKDGEVMDDDNLYFTDYDEAIEGFKEFLGKV
jgi:hypothetical protein